jgi:hypothetical protein
MSCRVSVALAFSLAAFTLVHAQSKPAAAAKNESVSKTATKSNPPAGTNPSASEDHDRLPVQRVVLYKNGVGYFEHSARVRGKQELNIDFTTSQLNDVIKSLTVVDLGQGRISSVRYNSIAPLSERLKALRLPFGEEVSRDDFLIALRGARVDVHSGSSTASGKLLSVDKTKRQTAKGDTVENTEFSIITDAGEMKNFELGPGTSVRLADRDLNDEVGRYLKLISSSRSRDLRRMTISASGSGDREIFVSYVSEVPVWKSTYRVILPEKAPSKPRLQGWAIVDNTIGEDWKDIHLTLVAGAPQSFIQEISQPFYVRRPVIPLPETVQLTPQSHEATLEEEKSQPAVAAAPPPGVVGPGVGSGIGSGSGRGIGGAAFAKKSTSSEMVDASADSIRTTTSMVNMAMAQNAEAEGKEVGDFFQYDLVERISLAKNQSALVPILNAPIEADKVTMWNQSEGALRALWLKNTSGQTLDAGTFNIIDSGTFAGEGIFSTIHPDERRLLSYAADTAIQIKSQTESDERPYTHVKIVDGMMSLTREQHQTTKYVVHNADTAPRDVVIEHPAQANWKLAKDAPKPEESSKSFHRFRVQVSGGKTETLAVNEQQAEDSQYMLTNLDSNLVAVLVKGSHIPATLQKTFDQILIQKRKLDHISEQIAQRQREVGELTQDQSRVRENMKALKGSAEEKTLTQRYTTQLNQQEDRFIALRKEIAELQAQLNQARQELQEMVRAVNLDEEM